jgi:hypothetical protein
VRHKAHTAAYASFDGAAGGMVLDLTEILDLSESGMSVRSDTPLPTGPLNLVLDLSETKAYVKASGSVAWRDKSGRTGMCFNDLSDTATRQIKEWLFANCLVAVSRNPAGGARISALVTAPPGNAGDAAPVVETPAEIAPATGALPESSQLAADGPALNDIQEQIEKLRGNTDAALRLLADRARSLTRATGAAIALAQGVEMVCRASSGDAPGLGARFQVGSGFSGECVHTGKLQQCDDAELDLRVDRESCRLLNIRSIVAAPVISHGTVVGLLEVFSPRSYAFGEAEAAALHRLAVIVEQSIRASGPFESSRLTDQVILPASSGDSRRIRLLALTRNNNVLVTLALVLILGIVMVALAPRLLNWPRRAAVAAPPPQPVVPEPGPQADAGTLEDLRKYAGQGDPVAQFALGARYAQGDEVKQNYVEAVRWFQKAAEQGHVVAQATLGAYYWAGRGVPQDLSKAYFWSSLARAGGDEASKYRVAALTSRMSRAQVTEAQQRVEEWLRNRQSASASPH